MGYVTINLRGAVGVSVNAQTNARTNRHISTETTPSVDGSLVFVEPTDGHAE